MKPRILVVDDDNSVRESLRKLLEAQRYDVLTARDSSEALEHFESDAIDLVVLDLKLGAVDGWETFERMTATNGNVPTVVITGEFGQRERAVAAGVEALFEKPMDVPLFLKVIQKLLAKAPEQPLARISGDENYCRYVGRDPEAFRRDLNDRYSTPLKMAWFEGLQLTSNAEEN